MLKMSQQTRKKIGAIIQKHQVTLLRKTNVIGTGIGEKIIKGQNTGRAALITFVERKLPTSMLTEAEMIQPIIDGVEVDVIEIGRPIIQANTARLRPAIAGISIGHPNVTAGTFGCVLRNQADGQLYVLSNNHVIADSNNGLFGDAIVQPGRADGGANPGDRIATLFRYPVINRPGNNLVDCAVALPTDMANVRAVTLDGWSDIKPVPGWFGSENQGADIAIADINGDGRPDLVVFHVDNPGGENHGYYRIGWNLDGNGNVAGGWSDIKPVPGWFGSEDQGAGIAFTDLIGNGSQDLLVFHIDNPSGENHGYYRIAFDLMPNGVPARWTIA